jgi:hypothetical protein
MMQGQSSLLARCRPLGCFRPAARRQCRAVAQQVRLPAARAAPWRDPGRLTRLAHLLQACGSQAAHQQRASPDMARRDLLGAALLAAATALAAAQPADAAEVRPRRWSARRSRPCPPLTQQPSRHASHP